MKRSRIVHSVRAINEPVKKMENIISDRQIVILHGYASTSFDRFSYNFLPRSLTVSHASRTTNIAFVSLMFTLLLMQWNENLCFLTRKHGFSEQHCTGQKSSRLWQYLFGADCENHKCQSHCGGQRISAWQQNNCSLYYPLPRSNTERNKGKVINKKQWRLNKEFSCIFPACP